MITKDITSLKIHKLSQEQYDRELEAGRIDANAIYLTPYDDNNANIFVQPDEPVGAEEGTLWYDTDEVSHGVIGGGVCAADNVFVQPDEPNNAPDGSLWVDTDEELSEGTNNGAVITETDPTVPAWAKAPTKPVYTASEVGADVKGSAATALSEAKAYTNAVAAAAEVTLEEIETSIDLKADKTHKHNWSEIDDKPSIPSVSGLASESYVGTTISNHNSASNAHSDIRSIIGDLNTLNTSSKSSIVEAINEAVTTGGSSSGIAETEYLTVTLSDDKTTASHSMSEIIAAVNEGKVPRLRIHAPECYLPFDGSDLPGARFSDTSLIDDADNSTNGGNVSKFTYTIDDNKNVTAAYRLGVLAPLAEQSDIGKVLSADGYGNLVWTESPSGLPSGGYSGQVLSLDDNGNPIWVEPAGGAGGSSGVSSRTIRTTLFSNTDTNSEFSARTISIENLSTFDEIYIECASDSGDLNMGVIRNSLTIDYEDNVTHALFATLIYNGTTVQLSRTVKISGEAAIIISDCNCAYGETVAIANQYMIPVKIIGIKYNATSVTSVQLAEGVLF